ncbi:acyl-CoA thioesterase [Fusarium falciforme]|nr:acyl-CoA thioesterase [Fusarium falciforme]
MLAIAAAPEQGEDVYTNTAPLWHPVWARGVFGGALLAQSLAVAQESIPLSYLAHRTVPRVHRTDRFNSSSAIKSIIRSLGSDDPSSRQIVRSYQELATEELEENARCGTPTAPAHHIGMMVTLDHTIFFHNQAVVRADEWMLTEVETPWAGQQRGLVVQRIWTSNGTLVATCFQEGLVRLERNEAGSKI